MWGQVRQLLCLHSDQTFKNYWYDGLFSINTKVRFVFLQSTKFMSTRRKTATQQSTITKMRLDWVKNTRLGLQCQKRFWPNTSKRLMKEQTSVRRDLGKQIEKMNSVFVTTHRRHKNDPLGYNRIATACLQHWKDSSWLTEGPANFE